MCREPTLFAGLLHGQPGASGRWPMDIYPAALATTTYKLACADIAQVALGTSGLAQAAIRPVQPSRELVRLVFIAL